MKRLTKLIDGTSIAIFRIGFGLVMIWELIYFIRIDFVKIFLTQPQVQFSYEFLSFLKPLPEPILNILVILLLACCFFIVIGRFYRQAMIVFFLGFSYLFLLDKAYYNNHLYLICLLSFLLIFIPADNKLAFSRKKPTEKKPVLYWHLLILKLQLVIVYFYGGLAKLNYDWLVSHEPISTILNSKAQQSFLGDFLTTDGVLYFFAFGGLLFDLLIPFLLFIKKTRIFAVICALLFNIMNAWLFNDINIFPYFMMLSLVLFLDPNKVSDYVRKKLFDKHSKVTTSKEVGIIKKPLLILMAVYFVIQALLPLRHLLFEGNVDWTGLGQRFAWRMKIQQRTTETLDFKVFNMERKVIIPVEVNSYLLNSDQIRLLSLDPRAAIHFAKFLKQRSIKIKGMKVVEVRSDIVVKFNGRPSQSIFDKSVDLSSLDYSPTQLNDNINKLPNNK